MKKLLFLMSFAVAVILSSCEHQNSSNGNQYSNTDNSNSNTQVNVTVEQKPVGLDLQALGELAKTATSAADLEKKLNQPGSINDIDLDNDGNVDYLSVVEYGSNNDRGFSVTDYLKNSVGSIDTNEIANITFSKTVNNQVTTNINGNNQIYGNNNASYSSTSLLTDLILFNYLFTPHGYYYGSYYGYRPAYYHPYRYVAYDTYHSNVTRTYKTTTYTKVQRPVASKIASPNANKVKSTYADSYKPITKRTYSDAKTSQKQFDVRDNSKPVKTNGFANKPADKPSYKSDSKPSYKSDTKTSYKSSSSNSGGGFKSSGGSRGRR